MRTQEFKRRNEEKAQLRQRSQHRDKKPPMDLSKQKLQKTKESNDRAKNCCSQYYLPCIRFCKDEGPALLVSAGASLVVSLIYVKLIQYAMNN